MRIGKPYAIDQLCANLPFARPPQTYGDLRSQIDCTRLRVESVPFSGACLAPSLMDDVFQMIEVACERLSADGCQPASGLRPSRHELLVDGDVALVLHLLQVDAQVTIGHFQSIAQLGEGERVDGGQDAGDGKPPALVQHWIELLEQALDGIHVMDPSSWVLRHWGFAVLSSMRGQVPTTKQR